jgi:hypothetical protein
MDAASISIFNTYHQLTLHDNCQPVVENGNQFLQSRASGIPYTQIFNDALLAHQTAWCQVQLTLGSLTADSMPKIQ